MVVLNTDKSTLSRIVVDLEASLYGLSLIILFIDTMYCLRPGIVYTVGRVSIVGNDDFTVFGTLLLDQSLFWIITIILSSIIIVSTRKKQYLFITLLGIAGFSTTMYMSKWITLMLTILSVIILSIVLIHERGWRSILKNIVYGIAVFEFLKIIYLASKALTGFYPWFYSAIHTNIVITYYSWFLIPAILYFTVFYGALRILCETGLRTHIIKKICTNLSKLWRELGERSKPITRSVSDSAISSYLFIGLVLSFFISILPYFPTLNPRDIPVNTDWIYYYNWLKQMISGDFSVLYAHSDRPLYLILLYSIWFVTRIDPRTLAVYHNIILLPLYTFSTYLLALKWAGRRVADITVLITPFSPIFLSFIYGGFQANLLAISLVFISIYLIMSNSKKKFLGGLLLFWLTMFVHEWTWTQYIFILTVYVFLRILKTRLEHKGFVWRDKILLCFVMISYIIDFAKQYLFNMYSAAVVVEKANIMAGPMPYVESLHWYITIYTGGTLDNPLFYATALLGLDIMGLSVPSLAVILSLLPSIMPWKIIMYRLLLNTPITVLTAHGLCRVGPKTRFLLLVSLIGIGLWRLYSIIPGLSLS